MPMRYHRTPPDYRTTVLGIGGVTVIRRPHVGCGDAPYIYDILDPRGQVVRTLASHPSADDAIAAARGAQYASMPASTDCPRNAMQGISNERLRAAARRGGTQNHPRGRPRKAAA